MSSELHLQFALLCTDSSCSFIVGLKAYIVLTFWAAKINLSGISQAMRSRSGPNSVYVDMSRGDNVQGILLTIGPFCAKWGLGRVPRSASFFSVW